MNQDQVLCAGTTNRVKCNSLFSKQVPPVVINERHRNDPTGLCDTNQSTTPPSSQCYFTTHYRKFPFSSPLFSEYAFMIRQAGYRGREGGLLDLSSV